mmetsp:Transcript_67740/g.202477  ORF Transcript_67740/g.202477 Transcript_67740/m.202477 type:complete len:222 (+) Transcript_67740:109-774(+)|eukprot:4566279-Prymnesium_polylepis.1
MLLEHSRDGSGLELLHETAGQHRALVPAVRCESAGVVLQQSAARGVQRRFRVERSEGGQELREPLLEEGDHLLVARAHEHDAGRRGTQQLKVRSVLASHLVRVCHRILVHALIAHGALARVVLALLVGGGARRGRMAPAERVVPRDQHVEWVSLVEDHVPPPRSAVHEPEGVAHGPGEANGPPEQPILHAGRARCPGAVGTCRRHGQLIARKAGAVTPSQV